jgi:hypothetical protein
MRRLKCKLASPYGFLRREFLLIHNGATGEIVDETPKGYVVEFTMYPSSLVHDIPIHWVSVQGAPPAPKKKSRK